MMIDQKALEAAFTAFNETDLGHDYRLRAAITAYEAAKPQPDQEALEIVLDAAEVIARLWTGERAYDLKIAIAKLRN
jgi:hypothetical protein